jgi:hypothetical protein
LESKKQLSVRLPLDLVLSFQGRCSSSGVSYQEVVQELITAFMAGEPAKAVQPSSSSVTATTERPQQYRKENLPWHDRLEMVLNDIDEALGIQKNLEWAERTVRDKQKRPAGKRASGM